MDQGFYPNQPTVEVEVQLYIDFDKMRSIFAQAAENGRFQLFEHETYELLAALGSESVLEYLLLERGERLSSDSLAQFLGEKVVLKVVSPDIVHKSDVDGVKVVPRLAGKVRSESRRMIDVVSKNYTEILLREPDLTNEIYTGLGGEDLQEAVHKRIKGVLVTQYLPPESELLGNELLVSLRWTREFGMVITAGLGGTDTELYAERFRFGQAVVSTSTADVSGGEFFELFKKTIAYQKLSGQARDGRRLVSDEQLIECFGAFIAVGNHFSPLNNDAPYVIEELEVNPFALIDYEMVPLDGLCRFTESYQVRSPRSVERVGNMLHPQSLALVGVSATKMNFGRHILTNMLKAGFPREKITLVSNRAEEIEGVRCVSEVCDVGAVDLMIVAVAASKVPPLIDDVLNNHLAESVILISGGMGETEESHEKAQEVVKQISRAHMQQGGGPVFLGGNCMGVISRGGQVDTFFTPEACSPKRRERDASPVALVSQSGAFALVRMADLVTGDPTYTITVGNQLDLTIGDCISWLADRSDVGVICLYVEGFQDLDGLHGCRGIRRAVAAGKEVIVYKAGRTPEGKKATSGHTASVAGDYMVCTSCLTQAGALVADTLEEFDGLMNLAAVFHKKAVTGYAVGALSPAGFETVGIADSLNSRDSALVLPALTGRSCEIIEEAFEQSGLAGIMEVRNPLDISPAAPGAVYITAIEAMLDDERIDAVVTSAGSLSPSTTDKPEPGQFSNWQPGNNSLVERLPELVRDAAKPLIVFNDAGQMHEPINKYLRDRGVPVFANCRLAMTMLARYTAYRELLNQRKG